MEEEAPLPAPPRCSSGTAIFATATTGTGGVPSSSSDHALLRMTTSSATQPELLHSSPCLSSSMIPSYQQIPPVPMFDGTSLHEQGISQPSFNASGNIVSTDLDVVVSSPIATLLSSLDVQVQQQQQPALPSSLASSVIFGQSDRFAGFSQSTWEHQAPQQGRSWSSSRSAGLPPRWRPPRSRIAIDTTTTFGYVQPSPDSKLAPLPPSLQTPPSPPVEQAANGSETLGQEACRSSLMDDSSISMVSMPNLSIEAGGSSGKLFTDAEMEKIRKEERLSHLMKTDPERVRRMLKNRESAKKSKERKKKHILGLEHQLRELEMERETLSRQAKLQKEALAEVRSHNWMLNTRLQGLEQQLKLQKELNEALISRIQNLKPANLSSSSSLHQEMSLTGGQCSNSGLHQHMRNDVHMSLHMIQEQPEKHQEDMAEKQPQENKWEFKNQDALWDM